MDKNYAFKGFNGQSRLKFRVWKIFRNFCNGVAKFKTFNGIRLIKKVVVKTTSPQKIFGTL